MDKYKVQQRLNKIFLDDNIIFHEKVIDEVKELVIMPGLAKDFVKLWEKNLKTLDELGMRAIETNNFEILQNTNGLFSMKFKGKNFNWRMIYSYDKKSKKLMLHFFYERQGGKDEYKEHIPIAKARKVEMEDGYEKKVR